jgi:hypothetical protein
MGAHNTDYRRVSTSPNAIYIQDGIISKSTDDDDTAADLFCRTDTEEVQKIINNRPNEEFKKLEEKYKKIQNSQDDEKVFKEYVEGFFPDEYFSIMDSDDDLMFRDRSGNKPFLIKCVFRTELENNRIMITDNRSQMQECRQLRTETKQPLYFMVGFKGRPDDPDKLFLINIDDMQYHGKFLSRILPYEIKKTPFNMYYEFKFYQP